MGTHWSLSATMLQVSSWVLATRELLKRRRAGLNASAEGLASAPKKAAGAVKRVNGADMARMSEDRWGCCWPSMKVGDLYITYKTGGGGGGVGARMIGGTEDLELERELDHPSRRCSNAYSCNSPESRRLVVEDLLRAFRWSQTCVLSTTSGGRRCGQGAGHEGDGGGKTPKEARPRSDDRSTSALLPVIEGWITYIEDIDSFYSENKSDAC
jgi:hypothetical protein